MKSKKFFHFGIFALSILKSATLFAAQNPSELCQSVADALQSAYPGIPLTARFDGRCWVETSPTPVTHDSEGRLWNHRTENAVLILAEPQAIQLRKEQGVLTLDVTNLKGADEAISRLHLVVRPDVTLLAQQLKKNRFRVTQRITAKSLSRPFNVITMNDILSRFAKTDVNYKAKIRSYRFTADSKSFNLKLSKQDATEMKHLLSSGYSDEKLRINLKSVVSSGKGALNPLLFDRSLKARDLSTLMPHLRDLWTRSEILIEGKEWLPMVSNATPRTTEKPKVTPDPTTTLPRIKTPPTRAQIEKMSESELGARDIPYTKCVASFWGEVMETFVLTDPYTLESEEIEKPVRKGYRGEAHHVYDDGKAETEALLRLEADCRTAKDPLFSLDECLTKSTLKCHLVE